MKKRPYQEQEMVKNILDKHQPNRKVFISSLRAFIFGGLISVIAQGFLDLYQKVFHLEDKMAVSMMSVTIVLITSVLTGFGIFDKIGQLAGAGTIIPITGFANSMTSAAIEGRSEGIILGIMTNMFKLAGAVIVAGVCSAMISGTLIYLVRSLG